MEEDLHIHSDSAVSTPYVSAPSSPGAGPPHSFAGGGFFYSAPASPTHHESSPSNSVLEGAGGGSFEFEFKFTVRQEATGRAPSGSMTSADELFLNGQIRPMKLSSHLQRPQDLAPLIDVLENDDDGEDEKDTFGRGRDLRSKPLRRRTRSMSPLRTNTAFQWLEEFKDARESTEINEIKEKLDAEEDRQGAEDDDDNETPSSGASSRSSSVGRSSKRWVFLKELLYRSKSEGRNSSSSNRNHKLWSTFSSSAAAAHKDKKSSDTPILKTEDGGGTTPKTMRKKAVNGLGMNGKRGVGRSAHEVHYTRKRAQAEEMRKKTYLPYRQGLLGCLGFSSKSYGAMNGFARALNPVSSR
ncbi:hypothetical protein L6452_22525 [Arctium lappa]|uniref:Uncharacterized protein n=1 Tax=Arctium lappa TaxID=4217 RepID=A0ACB9B0X9_ARCLA|nr:hypothetical protein L6452_22525 [Arctium lappa]